MLAASGGVKALLGGPPCRTVSALRYQEDGGPGVLRSEEFPYGLPTLSAADHELVTASGGGQCFALSHVGHVRALRGHSSA